MTYTTSSAAAQAAPLSNTLVFSYREAANQAEIEQLLQLRYCCFTNGTWEMRQLIERNPYAMDFDAFDEKALHLGIFLTENGKIFPVAYMRLVTISETKHSIWINNIRAKYPSIKVKKTENHFPFQEKINAEMSIVANDFIRNQAKNGLKVIEVSRICIDTQYSSAALCHFFVGACTAFGAGLHCDTTFVYIIKEGAEKIFARNGGQLIEGLSTQVFDMTFNAYFVNHDMVLPSKRSKINNMSYLFLQHKCIRFDEKEMKVF
jgi:hypothetical protein